MEIKLDFREIFCDWMVKHTIIFPFTRAPPPSKSFSKVLGMGGEREGDNSRWLGDNGNLLMITE